MMRVALLVLMMIFPRSSVEGFELIQVGKFVHFTLASVPPTVLCPACYPIWNFRQQVADGHKCIPPSCRNLHDMKQRYISHQQRYISAKNPCRTHRHLCR
ncbi:hypothetical protein DFJ43DRAFT_72673 [Lentinula guzmanii]|uniref:Secreted protein n=1 Tax=Lentinula guzmanii TaxID=2804957 RepID=A0AA38JYG1_9AGAR|nr:hypothetical protein DFJ43DRAFT_72673 [Lentinula guzmanii]